jgi:hypothetical protein
VLKVLDRGVWDATDDQQCVHRFGIIGKLALRAAVAEDRLAITTHLRGLLRGRAGEELNAARLLHSLGESLTGQDFALALRAYVEFPYPPQRDLLLSLVQAASGDVDREMRGAIEECIEQLALRPLDGSGLDPLAFVALPMLLWKAFDERSATSTTVFRSGVVALFRAGKDRSPADDLAELSKLLLETPKDLIREAIALPSEEPGAAVFTLLAAAISQG